MIFKTLEYIKPLVFQKINFDSKYFLSVCYCIIRGKFKKYNIRTKRIERQQSSVCTCWYVYA